MELRQLEYFVRIADTGRLLYERAENLLEFAHSTKKEVSEAGKRRVLRIGITSSTVPTVLPFIAKFALLNPDVSFEVHDGSSYTLLQLLLDGIIDISVARTPLWVGAGLATAIFPASMRSMCRELDIKTLSEPTLETETLLITKSGAVIAPLARELLAVCSELLGGR